MRPMYIPSPALFFVLAHRTAKTTTKLRLDYGGGREEQEGRGEGESTRRCFSVPILLFFVLRACLSHGNTTTAATLVDCLLV